MWKIIKMLFLLLQYLKLKDVVKRYIYALFIIINNIHNVNGHFVSSSIRRVSNLQQADAHFDLIINPILGNHFEFTIITVLPT